MSYMFLTSEMGFWSATVVAASIIGFSVISEKLMGENPYHESGDKHHRKYHILMAETFNNIKMIKLFGWENVFAGRIQKVRDDIEENDKNSSKIDTRNGVIYHLIEMLTPISVYVIYIYMGNTLTLTFVIISGEFIHRLQHLRHQIPNFFRTVRHMIRRYKKLQSFLDFQELQQNVREINTDAEVSLKVQGSFSWGLYKNKMIDEHHDEKKQKEAEEKAAKEALKKRSVDKTITLKNIDLTINKGEFVCIIGKNGSGKSNLLNAINGEMIYVPEELLSTIRGTEQESKFMKDFQDKVFDY